MYIYQKRRNTTTAPTVLLFVEIIGLNVLSDKIIVTDDRLLHIMGLYNAKPECLVQWL